MILEPQTFHNTSYSNNGRMELIFDEINRG